MKLPIRLPGANIYLWKNSVGSLGKMTGKNFLSLRIQRLDYKPALFPVKLPNVDVLRNATSRMR